MKEKRSVSMVELFYDLIFVYAISQMSEVLLVAFEDQGLYLDAIIKYCIVVLSFWSVWTYQTVYNNRFFKGSVINYIFILLNMFIVMVLSQSINFHFQETFFPFVLCTTLLYSIVLLEYCITFYSSNSALEKKFIISFIIILSIFISVSLVALIVPEEIRLIFNGVAILIISFLPIMFKERIKSVSVDFEHLTERYSLLVILFFGESIVTVTKTINLTSIHITSFFYFLIIIALFSIYSLIHTKGIEKNRQTGGLILIHMHYFVILSIGFVSILLEENIHQEINNAVFSIFLTIGITVFLAALFINWFSYSTNQITAKFMIMISVLLCLFYMNNLLIENMDIYLGMDMILLWLIFGAVYRELKE